MFTWLYFICNGLVTPLYVSFFHMRFFLLHFRTMFNTCTILFCICLFQLSTCFEHPCAHNQENQLYQYDIWYMSLYVGDRQICIPDYHLHRVTYTRYRIDRIDSPDDEHMGARNM
jgi:hypothetical protein